MMLNYILAYNIVQILKLAVRRTNIFQYVVEYTEKHKNEK